jgi:hypothetical protein
LWAECSDASSLARHLGQFGEIKITRLEPETAVAWEGELASGTVRLESSGWGTKVTLTARTEADGAAAEDDAVVAEAEAVADPAAVGEPGAVPEPAAAAEPLAVAPLVLEPPAPLARPGFMARLRAWFAGGREMAPVVVSPEPEAVAEPFAVAEPEPVAVAEPEPSPAAVVPEPDPGHVLGAALDSLGQAHHRPFSRA